MVSQASDQLELFKFPNNSSRKNGSQLVLDKVDISTSSKLCVPVVNSDR